MSTRQSKSSAALESIGVAAYWVFTTCYCSLGGLALIAILAAVVVAMTGLPYGVATAAAQERVRFLSSLNL